MPGFEKPTSADMASATMTLYTPAGANPSVLPSGVAEKLLALRDRASRLHRQVPLADERAEANMDRQKAQQRLEQLRAHPHDNGFGLRDSDARVIQQREHVEALTAATTRLQDQYERAIAMWTPAARVLTNAEAWLKSPPLGTVLEDAPEPKVTLQKGEDLLTGIERLRQQAGKIKADLARIYVAPYPSAYCKRRMRETVEAIAQGPNVTNLVERDGNITWPEQSVRAQVFNTGQPAIAFAEVPATIGLFAWAFKAALIERLEAEIDSKADDKTALSHDERQMREAELASALMEVERDESALVWRAQGQDLPAEHRIDCHVLAVLGGQLLTIPAGDTPTRSSPEHAGYSLVGVR